MSYEIEIEFDQPDRHFVANDMVVGQVHIIPEKDIDTDEIIIRLYWKTIGKGTDEKEIIRELDNRFAVEKWYQGQRYTFPFEFALPEQPLTYHGRNLKIDYFVEADVLRDRKMVLTPRFLARKRTKADILVTYDLDRYDRILTVGYVRATFSWRRIIGVLLICFMVGLVSILLVQGYNQLVSYGEFYEMAFARNLQPLGGLGVLPLFLFLGLPSLYYLLMRKRADLLGVDFVDSPLIGYQSSVESEVAVDFDKPVVINSAEIRFVIQEKAINRAGTSDTTYTYKLHQSKNKTEFSTQLSSREHTIPVTFTLNDPITPPFKMSNNMLDWHLFLNLETDHGPVNKKIILNIDRQRIETVNSEDEWS